MRQATESNNNEEEYARHQDVARTGKIQQEGSRSICRRSFDREQTNQ
jgi:hypothetical protein